MKQLLACLVLLFVWDVSAASKPDAKDDDRTDSLSVVTIPADDEKSSKDVVIDFAGASDIPGAMAVHVPSFEVVDGVSQGGVAWMNRSVESVFKGLTEDQQRYVTTCAAAGNFDPGSVSVNFWKFVSYVSDPIGNLAKVAVVVLPLFASSGYGTLDSEHSDYYGYSTFSAKMGIATSISGIIALTFDKICGYANEKIANQEKISICLQAMKTAKKGS